MTMIAEDLCAEQTLKPIMNTLQDRIGPQKFNAWFKHGTELTLDDEQIKVLVPNPFVANWIEQHYQADLVESFHQHTNRRLPVVVTVDASLSSRCSKRDLDIQAEIVNRTTQGRVRPRRTPANPQLKHRLKDFVVGPSNYLAYQAALNASNPDDRNFTQLFVHGPCGVGKTHLLQGICNEIANHQAGGRTLRWKYVTGEQFTNEFIAAVRTQKSGEFRDKYRNLDLLAIDDVHFLAAKRATQDEFLHTFNAIESAGRQIILASDSHPRLVGDLNEGLVSRFLSGMVVKVDAPDKDTRLEILRRKAASLKLTMSPEVADYIAMHIRGSVRELEGTVVKLSAIASLQEAPVTLALVREALSDHLARTDSATTLGDIEAIVAPFFGVTPADIHSSRRTKTVSAARMVAMHLARRYTPMSFPEIGRFMGKNHSSVVLAVQRLEQSINKNEEIDWNTPAGLKAMPAKTIIQLLEEQLNY